MKISRSVCVAASGSGSLCFLWLSNIPVCVCVCVFVCEIFLNQSSVDGHLGCLHMLTFVNSAAINIGIHVSLLIVIFSRYMPRSGIAGSYGSSVFRF